MTPVTEPHSVSHGTMRLKDIVPAFEEKLIRIGFSLPRLESDRPSARDIQDETEDALWYCEELFDALNDWVRAKASTLGAHPGDGSDYGFWPIEDD